MADLNEILQDINRAAASESPESVIAQRVGIFGSSGLLTQRYTTTSNIAEYFYDGPEFGATVEAGTVPIIYGKKMLVAGQTVDGGDIRSNVDPSKIQKVFKIRLGEGPIGGVIGGTPEQQLQNTFINCNPTMNKDGTPNIADLALASVAGAAIPYLFNEIAEAIIGDTDPATGLPIKTKLNDPNPTGIKLIDLADVVPGGNCKDQILVSDGSCKWVPKAFNQALIDAGMTVDGGASLVNVGTGHQIYTGENTEGKSKIRSIQAGTNVTITSSGDTIVINASGGSSGGGTPDPGGGTGGGTGGTGNGICATLCVTKQPPTNSGQYKLYSGDNLIGVIPGGSDALSYTTTDSRTKTIGSHKIYIRAAAYNTGDNANVAIYRENPPSTDPCNWGTPACLTDYNIRWYEAVVSTATPTVCSTCTTATSPVTAAVLVRASSPTGPYTPLPGGAVAGTWIAGDATKKVMFKGSTVHKYSVDSNLATWNDAVGIGYTPATRFKPFEIHKGDNFVGGHYGIDQTGVNGPSRPSYSTDGINWQWCTSPVQNLSGTPLFGSGKWVFYDNFSHKIWTSSNGGVDYTGAAAFNWYYPQPGPYIIPRFWAFAGGNWYFFAQEQAAAGESTVQVVYRSSDTTSGTGIGTKLGNLFGPDLTTAARFFHDGTRFICEEATRIWISTDAQSWTQILDFPTGFPHMTSDTSGEPPQQDICSTGSAMVVLTGGLTFKYTTNYSTWQDGTVPKDAAQGIVADSLHSVTHDGTNWYFLGA